MIAARKWGRRRMTPTSRLGGAVPRGSLVAAVVEYIRSFAPVEEVGVC